ncbi:hypothetical protein RJ640_012137 [Escallonia rubra]|uniref:Uncharacterized protein n=1 Tax=Escallonia rubra TaxID=112253 RepID=A0AA88UN64_9ASTE|nr:hypothetical protein RJ640_012137 [Escallonia rubra]
MQTQIPTLNGVEAAVRNKGNSTKPNRKDTMNLMEVAIRTLLQYFGDTGGDTMMKMSGSATMKGSKKRLPSRGVGSMKKYNTV